MVQENLKTVRERIEAACRRVGRDPDEVTLIAVSKTKPVEMMRKLMMQGSGISEKIKFRKLPGNMRRCLATCGGI